MSFAVFLSHPITISVPTFLSAFQFFHSSLMFNVKSATTAVARTRSRVPEHHAVGINICLSIIKSMACPAAKDGGVDDAISEIEIRLSSAALVSIAVNTRCQTRLQYSGPASEWTRRPHFTGGHHGWNEYLCAVPSQAIPKNRHTGQD